MDLTVQEETEDTVEHFDSIEESEDVGDDSDLRQELEDEMIEEELSRVGGLASKTQKAGEKQNFG